MIHKISFPKCHDFNAFTDRVQKFAKLICALPLQYQTLSPYEVVVSSDELEMAPKDIAISCPFGDTRIIYKLLDEVMPFIESIDEMKIIDYLGISPTKFKCHTAFIIDLARAIEQGENLNLTLAKDIVSTAKDEIEIGLGHPISCLSDKGFEILKTLAEGSDKDIRLKVSYTHVNTIADLHNHLDIVFKTVKALPGKMIRCGDEVLAKLLANEESVTKLSLPSIMWLPGKRLEYLEVDTTCNQIASQLSDLVDEMVISDLVNDGTELKMGSCKVTINYSG